MISFWKLTITLLFELIRANACHLFQRKGLIRVMILRNLCTCISLLIFIYYLNTLCWILCPRRTLRWPQECISHEIHEAGLPIWFWLLQIKGSPNQKMHFFPDIHCRWEKFRQWVKKSVFKNIVSKDISTDQGTFLVELFQNLFATTNQYALDALSLLCEEQLAKNFPLIQWQQL
jgi:hypothetical protein